MLLLMEFQVTNWPKSFTQIIFTLNCLFQYNLCTFSLLYVSCTTMHMCLLYPQFENTFLRFFDNPKNATFYVFEVSCQKNVKRRKHCQSFYFETATKHFICKTITHMSCYTYNIILKLFIFGYNTIWPCYCAKDNKTD